MSRKQKTRAVSPQPEKMRDTRDRLMSCKRRRKPAEARIQAIKTPIARKD